MAGIICGIRGFFHKNSSIVFPTTKEEKLAYLKQANESEIMELLEHLGDKYFDDCLRDYYNKSTKLTKAKELKSIVS